MSSYVFYHFIDRQKFTFCQTQAKYKAQNDRIKSQRKISKEEKEEKNIEISKIRKKYLIITL